MSAQIQVREYMLHETPVIQGDTPLNRVTEILCNEHLLGLPVVDENNKLIGFVSEQDCIQKMVACSYHCEITPMARDVMRAEVLTVSPGDSIIELAESMRNNKPKIYPVVDNGRLLGVINRTQILKALCEHLEECKVPV